VSGRVLNVEKRPMRGRRRTRIIARVADDTATISVTWFNQPWLADRLKPGTEVRLRGKLSRYGFEPRSYDIGDEARATADFAPVYPAAEEIAAATVRRVVDAALPLTLDVADPLPAELRESQGLALKRDALAAVHRPRDLGEAEAPRFDDEPQREAQVRRIGHAHEQVGRGFAGGWRLRIGRRLDLERGWRRRE